MVEAFDDDTQGRFSARDDALSAGKNEEALESIGRA
jgi:hypothetical protein